MAEYNLEPGNVAYVVAGVNVRHKAIASDDGYTGVAIKQKIPAADGVRADRDLIVAGEAYILALRGKCDVLASDLPGITKGTLVYVVPATNAVSVTATNNLVLGRVSELAGERGTPADKVRINMDQRV